MLAYSLRFISLLVFTATITIAETATNTAMQPEPRPTAEILVLRAQLDTTRDFDQRLLGTVQWSLGIVVATLAVLVGYNWYTNHREIERDKAALKEELAVGLKALDTSFRELIATKMIAAEKEFRAASESTTDALRDQVNKRFLAQDIKVYTDTAEDWEKQKIPANAVLYRLRALQKLGPNVNHGQLATLLDQIKQNLKAITPPATLSAGIVVELTEYLATLPPKFDVEKASVLEILRTLRK